MKNTHEAAEKETLDQHLPLDNDISIQNTNTYMSKLYSTCNLVQLNMRMRYK